ncbi:HugZ family pyridoxamine 5'-phosphate oxidase [Acidimangrovimonas sediminis]|uniref:HugZ family pyridoxamine 5'-phosphate oxidase n=1 Tax=Acidimangrovimonas sediminis TaxID=2056283 RepID=UPI000C80DD63|nr:pyridoxamine 5'-phosphate oxidase family protein [Acidimangrovimonas sediminis]
MTESDQDRPSPIRPTDDAARALARDLLQGATFAALAVTDPASGAPFVSRIALGLDPEGLPVTLISTLAAHTAALKADPRCALLIGEPGPRGDPLTHPRLSLQATARFIPRDGPDHAALRAHYLASHPKAKLYADFADFGFVVFDPSGAALNGGFGRAFHLTPADLLPR